MKLIEIANRVAAIREMAWDEDKAHGLEDALHRDVLLAIAEGTLEDADPVIAARAVLDTLSIDFSRWTA